VTEPQPQTPQDRARRIQAATLATSLHDKTAFQFHYNRAIEGGTDADKEALKPLLRELQAAHDKAQIEDYVFAYSTRLLHCQEPLKALAVLELDRPAIVKDSLYLDGKAERLRIRLKHVLGSFEDYRYFYSRPVIQHQMAGVSCLDCHTIHQSRTVMGQLTGVEGMAVAHATAPAAKGSLAKPQVELCLGCHQQIRTKLMQQSRHPIREGRMTCSSCHESHGAGIKSVKSTERVNDLCLSCHTQHQGPFVFEHAPVEESCMTCHDPHGAMANNMLKQNEPFLCLQCHEMHFHAARAGQTTPYLSPSAGLIANKGGATGFMQAYNTRCTNCHVKVHGSDLPSQGVTGKGKAITR